VYADRIFSAGGWPQLLAKFNAPGYAEKINQDRQTAQHRQDFVIGQQNLKKLFDAGVNVGFGTDSGALPGRIPGFSEHRELELMVEAGLTPMQAITAATGGECKAAALVRSRDDCGRKTCGPAGAGCGSGGGYSQYAEDLCGVSRGAQYCGFTG